MPAPRWERLGYRSEHDYRAHDFGRLAPGSPGLTGEARAQAVGKRGPSAFAAAIASAGASHVIVRGKYSEQVIARVKFADGRAPREFIIQRTAPKTSDEAERNRIEFERVIDRMDATGLAYDVSVSR